MKFDRTTPGHLAALLTIFIWGTTFISTKILLKDFQPIEILLFRFLLGAAALFLVCPRRIKGTSPKQELTLAAAGLCGICLYYLLENIALTYTMASNVGVILSVAPFLTVILTHWFLRGEEKLRLHFFLGFLVAIVGICLISFNGAQLAWNPKGDLAGPAGGFCLGLLFYFNQEDQRLGISHRSDYPPRFSLWHPVYAPYPILL